MLLEAIRRETVANCDKYLPFVYSMPKAHFFYEMNRYIYERVYDSKYGDLVPLITANALSINIIIVSKTDNCYSSRTVQSSHKSGTNHPSVMVLKTGDHYDALVPNDQLNFISENCDVNVSGVHSTNYDNAEKVESLGDSTTPSISIIGSDPGEQENIRSVKSKHKSFASCKKCQSIHQVFSKKTKIHKGFKVAHINVRSLYNKLDEVRSLLTESDLDVLCISETWLDDTISDSEINILGYIPERKERNRQGGGVMMYIRDSIAYKIRSDIALSAPHVENLWIEFKLLMDVSCLMCSMYRPPSAGINY